MNQHNILNYDSIKNLSEQYLYGKKGSLTEIDSIDHTVLKTFYKDKHMTISVDDTYLYISSNFWGSIKGSQFSLELFQGPTNSVRHGKIELAKLKEHTTTLNVDLHNNNTLLQLVDVFTINKSSTLIQIDENLSNDDNDKRTTLSERYNIPRNKIKYIKIRGNNDPHVFWNDVRIILNKDDVKYILEQQTLENLHDRYPNVVFSRRIGLGTKGAYRVEAIVDIKCLAFRISVSNGSNIYTITTDQFTKACQWQVWGNKLYQIINDVMSGNVQGYQVKSCSDLKQENKERQDRNYSKVIMKAICDSFANAMTQYFKRAASFSGTASSSGALMTLTCPISSRKDEDIVIGPVFGLSKSDAKQTLIYSLLGRTDFPLHPVVTENESQIVIKWEKNQ